MLQSVGGPAWPGVDKMLLAGCTGDGTGGTAICRVYAEQWGNAAGMFRHLALTDKQAGELVLAGFSAGGHLWRRLLARPEFRARVRGALFADATYSSEGSAASPAPVSGVVEYALDALRDPSKVLVATASSSPNKNFGSGEQVLLATMREVEKRSGVRFREGGTLQTTPPPERVFRSPGGNIVFAMYGTRAGGHAGHPGLAPQVWRATMLPLIERSGLQSPWLVAAAAAAAGAAVATVALRHVS